MLCFWIFRFLSHIFHKKNINHIFHLINFLGWMILFCCWASLWCWVGKKLRILYMRWCRKRESVEMYNLKLSLMRIWRGERDESNMKIDAKCLWAQLLLSHHQAHSRHSAKYNNKIFFSSILTRVFHSFCSAMMMM